MNEELLGWEEGRFVEVTVRIADPAQPNVNEVEEIMKQLDTKALSAACEAVLAALAPPICSTREESLQVIMHVTAALLEGKDVPYVTSYLLKITQMLDGKFDRGLSRKM